MHRRSQLFSDLLRAFCFSFLSELVRGLTWEGCGAVRRRRRCRRKRKKRRKLCLCEGFLVWYDFLLILSFFIPSLWLNVEASSQLPLPLTAVTRLITEQMKWNKPGAALEHSDPAPPPLGISSVPTFFLPKEQKTFTPTHNCPPTVFLTLIFNMPSDRQRPRHAPSGERLDLLYVVIKATSSCVPYFFFFRRKWGCVFVHVRLRWNPGISPVLQKEGGNGGKGQKWRQSKTNKLIYCSGKKPWAGMEGRNACGWGRGYGGREKWVCVCVRACKWVHMHTDTSVGACILNREKQDTDTWEEWRGNKRETRERNTVCWHTAAERAAWMLPTVNYTSSLHSCVSQPYAPCQHTHADQETHPRLRHG